MILFFDEGDPSIVTDPDSIDLFNTGPEQADPADSIAADGSAGQAALAQEGTAEGSEQRSEQSSEQQAEQIDLSEKMDEMIKMEYGIMLLLSAIALYMFLGSIFRSSSR